MLIRVRDTSFSRTAKTQDRPRTLCRNDRPFNTRTGVLNTRTPKVRWQTPRTSETLMPPSKQTPHWTILVAMFVPRGEGNLLKKTVQKQLSSRRKSSPSMKVVHAPRTTMTLPKSSSLWPLETTGHACVLSVPCLTIHRSLLFWTCLGPRRFRPQGLTLCKPRSLPNL